MSKVMKGKFPFGPESNYLVPDMFASSFRDNKNRTAIIFEDCQLTYGELDLQSNKIANWATSNGLSPGDTVALLMENRPEFFSFFFAFTKIGVRIALINTALQMESLVHCLREVDAKQLFVGAELSQNYLQTNRYEKFSIKVWCQGGDIDGLTTIDSQIAEASDHPIKPSLRGMVKANDPTYFLFTSGTTGMPKAAVVSHMRVYGVLHTHRQVTGLKPKGGRLYVTLPVFHGTGLIASLSAFYWGSTVILRRKFSASHFWSDCVKYRATSFVYIGELMRYLVNTPTCEAEALHKIESCGGNGLRPDVWDEFSRRFGINNIVEFYGASEGNFGLLNLDGKPGAVGRLTGRIPGHDEIKIVRYDVENDELYRDMNGFCLECDHNEAGEAIRLISSADGTRGVKFEGYTNDQANEKKVLHNVFKKGDIYYRSGDLLKKDKDGYFYFVDRIGDTFRWKGENVATSEVSEIMSRCGGLDEANVYGVMVPRNDGRAGMATITVSEPFDLETLADIVDQHLPIYARPQFIRIGSAMETTGTFKYRKVDLQRDGFDPGLINDALYYRDPKDGHYKALNSDVYENICNGEIRL
jgi:fatty-acyl-CoA synthase